MIGNRNQGLRLLCHLVVMVYMLSLFVGMLLFWVVELDIIRFESINSPLYLFGIFGAGLLSLRYNPDQGIEFSPFRMVAAIKRSNQQALVLVIVLFGIIFSTKDSAISRLFIGSYLVLFWVTSIPLNRWLPDIISSLVFGGRNQMRTIFLGSARSARKLEDWAEKQPFVGMEILGLVSYEMVTGQSDLKMPVIGEFIELADIIRERSIDQVVLLETRNSNWWVETVMETCRKAGSRILIFNQWEEYFEQELIPFHQEGHTFFALQQEPLENPLNQLLKRAMDIAISVPVVFLMLPPLYVLVAVFQRMQSPGPVIYAQDRGGQRGQKFRIFKFRSMHHNLPKEREGEQARKNDDRVFPFGEFIRKTSIDELPQFINVLRGDMSVIGPRPHLINFDREQSAIVDIYKTRHFVRPGISGLAQCKGFRGEITDVELIRERVRYDLEYIVHWSIWLDISIVFKTALQVIKPPKSAY